MYGRFAGTARMRHGWGPGGGGGRGRGAQPEPPPADDVAAWFTGRLPDDWFTAAPEIVVDREEILVVGELAAPTEEFADEAASLAEASVPGVRWPRRSSGGPPAGKPTTQRRHVADRLAR